MPSLSQVRLRPIRVELPFPWTALLEYLSHRLIPEIETIDGGHYVRRVGAGAVKVAFDADTAHLTASAEGVVDENATLIAVSRLFDAEFKSGDIEDKLRQSEILSSRIDKVPGMRPLGCWDPFELCVRTILGQQVTVAAAGTLMRRWVQRCGEITPQCVSAADLAGIGMPGKRVEAIRTLARAVQEQRLRFDQPWEQIDASLRALPGFGPWTREYLAIRLGRQPDAFPSSDLGLIRAANVSTPAALLELAESWRPYRAYAATYLWAVR